MRRFCGILPILLCGCGGTSHRTEQASAHEQTARERELAAFQAERDALDAERPASPFVDERAAVYRLAATGCGQGPYRIPFQAVGAAHGERLRVYACTSRSIAGSYRLRQGEQVGQPRTFGFRQDNGRCTATTAELARTGVSTQGGGSHPGATTPARTGGTATEPAAEPVVLEAVPSGASFECPRGTYAEQVTDHSFLMHGPTAPLQAGHPMQIDVWSELPNDLAGVFFVVDQDVVRRDMTTEQWLAHLEAERAWGERRRALLDREVAAGVTTLLDSTPRAAEPPPPPRADERPPRPSDHAEWIAGYWHFENRWSWIPGWWRVPEADVAADLVVRAPSPPPAPRAEVPDAKPARAAVWTAGSWQWDGRAYVWVAGAWRIPPTASHRWRPSGWRASGSFSVFVPGGWILGR